VCWKHVLGGLLTVVSAQEALTMLMTFATLGAATWPGGVSGSGVDLVRVRDRAAVVLQYFNAAIAGLSNHVKVGTWP